MLSYRLESFPFVVFQEAISILRPCDDVTTLYWNPACEEALSSLADTLSIDGTVFKMRFFRMSRDTRLKLTCTHHLIMTTYSNFLAFHTFLSRQTTVKQG